jgi:hypothetical protein
MALPGIRLWFFCGGHHVSLVFYWIKALLYFTAGMLLGVLVHPFVNFFCKPSGRSGIIAHKYIDRPVGCQFVFGIARAGTRFSPQDADSAVSEWRVSAQPSRWRISDGAGGCVFSARRWARYCRTCSLLGWVTVAIAVSAQAAA